MENNSQVALLHTWKLIPSSLVYSTEVSAPNHCPIIIEVIALVSFSFLNSVIIISMTVITDVSEQVYLALSLMSHMLGSHAGTLVLPKVL